MLKKIRKKIEKNRDWVNVAVVIFVYNYYRELPRLAQVYLPLLFVVWGVFKSIQLVLRKSPWDESLRMVLLSIMGIAGFVIYYNEMYHEGDNPNLIVLLISLWLFPAFVYTGLVTCKRTGDMERWKLGRYLFFYMTAMCVVLTIVLTGK